MPADKWEKTLSCEKSGFASPQPNSQLIGDIGAKQDEDCLHLNIWTPAKTAEEKLPVMVWIHGGGFYAGAASQPIYNGSELAKQGIIVVGINYRLGPFGFLAHSALSEENPSKTSGNYGILDQLAALKWVKENISVFGGDPENVTIAGQSAGGVSVSLLMCSPLSAGLFNKAIAESGWAPKNLRALKKTEGVTTVSAEEIGAIFLKKLKVKTIADARKRGYGNLLNAWAEALKDVPTSETNAASSSGKHVILDGYVLLDQPYKTFSEDRQLNVPFLAGFTEHDGSLFAGYMNIQTAKDYEKYVWKLFGEDATKILAAYPAGSNKEVYGALSSLLGDCLFADGALQAAKFASRRQKNTYLYIFSALSNSFEKNGLGSFHGSELPFVFNSTTVGGSGLSKKEKDLSQSIMKYWSNFAKNGNPNGEKLPVWEPFNLGTQSYIILKEGFPSGAEYKPNQMQLFAK